MSDDLFRVYRVWDTEEECFWYSPNGKTLWLKPGYAKSAVNANPPKFMRRDRYTHYIKFSEQARFVIKSFVLVEEK